MIRVGILGFSRREGTFSEVGLRSWEEAGCAAVEAALMSGDAKSYTIHRPLVTKGGRIEIEKILRDWCDAPNIQTRCQLILTVGAVGYSKTDVVPEATQALIKYAAPGISEMVRRAAADVGYFGDSATRGVAGIRGSTLLINLPGIAKGFANPEPLTAATLALLPFLPDLLADIQ